MLTFPFTMKWEWRGVNKMSAIDPENVPESLQEYFSSLADTYSEEPMKLLALVWNRSWDVAQGVDRVD